MFIHWELLIYNVFSDTKSLVRCQSIWLVVKIVTSPMSIYEDGYVQALY